MSVRQNDLILAHLKAGRCIDPLCLDCCHWDREEIKHCTVILCPLHSFRPFQPKA